MDYGKHNEYYYMEFHVDAVGKTDESSELPMVTSVVAEPAPSPAVHSAQPASKSAAELPSAASLPSSLLEDPGSTMRFPRYISQLPMAIQFVFADDKYTLRIMERYELPVPVFLVAAVVPAAFGLLFCAWVACCPRSSGRRDGLKFGVLCESMSCFLCMWAQHAARFTRVSASRAWGWVIAVAGILSVWHVVDVVSRVQKVPEETRSTIFWVFQVTFGVVWFAFALERMLLRKAFRRGTDPFADDAQCGDCAVELCCPQLSALQEVQFISGKEHLLVTEDVSQLKVENSRETQNLPPGVRASNATAGMRVAADPGASHMRW